MDFLTQRNAFVERVLGELAASFGYHPVEMVCPELTPFGELAAHVRLRRHPDGYWQMLMLSEAETPEDMAEASRKVSDFAESHPELTADNKLRISLVGIGLGVPHGEARRRLFKPLRMLENQLVIRRFWLSLDRRRMTTFYSPWSLAPAFELNPIDPDENAFVSLVRRDRYLKEAPAPRETEDFHRRTLARERHFVSGLSGRRVLVRTVLALNILIWLAVEFTGGSTSPAQLVRAGAKLNGLIAAGQYWRVVTPLFLHFGLMHLVLNSAGLLVLGEVLERIYGTAQFALLYFVAGILSVMASAFFGSQLMVGASGAIFGLAGALVVYGYRYRRRIPLRYSAMFGGGLLPLIGLNILLGVLVKGIDNSAHIAGLAAGAALALTLTPLADRFEPPAWYAPRRLAALLILGVVAGSLLAGGVSFFRYDTIFKTDQDWMSARVMPGGVTVRVPATWFQTVNTGGEAAWQSLIYPARLDARQLDEKQPEMAFLTELQRMGKAGFRPVGSAEMLRGVWNGLQASGRVEMVMPGPRGMKRHEVFLRTQKAFLSLGVDFPEKDAAEFESVLQNMLEPLPRPRQQ